MSNPTLRSRLESIGDQITTLALEAGIPDPGAALPEHLIFELWDLVEKAEQGATA